MRWLLVHAITKLELGGAQLATISEVSHSRFGGAGRFLLSGPGGMLDAEASQSPDFTHTTISNLCRPVAPRMDLAAVWEMRSFLGQLRASRPGVPILFHTHSSKAGILGRAAARLAGVDRIVHTIHGFGHSHHGSVVARRLFLQAERGAGRVCHGFTADSAANLHQARGEGLIGAQPSRVVRCGIDPAVFEKSAGEALRSELAIPKERPVVLGLFCLKPQKDPGTFVAVARKFCSDPRKPVFLLAGDGELRAQLESAGLPENLRLLGWRRDVPELLGAADVLLHTSRWEGLPQSFAQAIAAGVPIVATDVDGAPEAVDSGISGFLRPVGDEDGLAEDLGVLLADPDLRTRFANTAKARLSLFSTQRMIEDLDALYEEVCFG